MKVAVMYSGGKDSTFAIDYCLRKGWDIRYLLSVKPSRKDCYLFHYATVEHTVHLAQMLGVKHILAGCDVADPALEAQIVKDIVAQHPVDAVVLGGTGLQETQIRSIQQALRPLGIEAFASHAGLDHDQVMQQMLDAGYTFIISQYAVEGLGPEWLGRVIDRKAFAELIERSKRFGFHCGGEGGHYDSFTIDGPIFKARIDILKARKVVEDAYNGHLEIEQLQVVEKPVKAAVQAVLTPGMAVRQ
jgi:predicted ATP pyrophosphatase (TIGR00289 family)